MPDARATAQLRKSRLPTRPHHYNSI